MFPYWQKQTKPLFEQILWNLPEQATGTLNLIGGNSQNFATIIRSAEFLNQLNLKSIQVILPDSLSTKLPPITGLKFTESTNSGSFAPSTKLNYFTSSADFNLYLGDFSKNSATTVAIADAIKTQVKPCLITRDGIDLLLTEFNDLIQQPDLFLVASLVQLQKVFRTIYYPKMLLLSMPLLPVIETLHKFTLSYPITILTLHQDQIIVASQGQIITTALNLTSFTPLSLWSGTLASKVAVLNLWSPGQPLAATATALFWDHRQKSPF
ncbi:MAG: hypothetical protein Q4A30_00715 [Candidatus Saccharibacteria bacterium]|nr:hypothetical protein [Candidatus Saccharibacteria bacterium]